jgi:hypothetical protein
VSFASTARSPGVAPALSDFDHDPAAYPSLDDAPAGLHHPREIDLARHRGEFACVEIGRQSFPGLPPAFERAHHGIYADERHPAQIRKRPSKQIELANPNPQNALLDKFGGFVLERCGDIQPNRLRGDEIDDEIEFFRQLDRHVGGFCST